MWDDVGLWGTYCRRERMRPTSLIKTSTKCQLSLETWSVGSNRVLLNLVDIILASLGKIMCLKLWGRSSNN